MDSVTADTDQIASARARLQDVRAGLLVELGEEIEAPGQMTYGSQAAAASHVFAQQRDLHGMAGPRPAGCPLGRPVAPAAATNPHDPISSP